MLPSDAAGLFVLDSAPPVPAGPPLLLVHGAGGSHRHWPAELRALPGRRVLALDLPGHGASAGPSPETVAELAQAVLALLDRLGLAQAVIAGHSMGGAVALSLALDAPARVAGLVLVGSGARLRVAPAVLEATARPEGMAQAAEAIAGASFGAAAPAELGRQLAAGLLANAPGVVHGDFAACDRFDVLPRLGEIRAPTLVVCGEDDRLTPAKYSERLRAAIAGARLVLVPGAGHFVMQEQPGAVAREVEAFLATLA